MDFFPPSSPTIRVSAAAWPMGYGSSFVTTKYLRMSAVKINPNSTPPNTTIINFTRFTSASGFNIKIPGNVNANPPAVMAPADIAVCVTLISLMFVFPNSFRKNMETKATKIMGHGNAPSFRATYIELMVKTTAPIAPIIIPLTVSCSLKEVA